VGRSLKRTPGRRAFKREEVARGKLKKLSKEV